MDQLYMLRAFVSAAQHQSFSKAAASLGVTTGSISKAIAKLEASIQTRVLHRTTRSVTLTEEAQSYYLSCCRLLEELDEANRRIMREREVDSGKLRLVIHPMLVSDTFSQFLSSYREVAPNVNLVVSVHEGAVNLYDGQFDMAMLPPHQVEQSAVIRRTLFRSSRSLVASADYLARRGTPRRAADLSEHFLLLPTQSRQRNTNYVQMIENDEPVQVIPMSSMDGNDVLLRAAALAGAGIAELPEAIARDDMASGKLVPVLPNCSISDSEVEVCLFYSHRELLPARFRTFVDFCTDFFRVNGARRRAPLLDMEQQAA
ncbi:LysR family transcriptional regulator [Paraburkholderia phymatum]|uniref:Transcriptional regulator, LysR family n=1 Tax=Paraburkholderia phymatum (strain DSM 17167 / CIP 108236 / LMG 21445 / STM815) TaxID=391038 RepID=B2JUY2_PARP8|nr:LysR family transcriptional regulator [Paraburkholderia phymatum]ACC74760.1 transcriptional regulator, LysR family [Paraburkholderia phymatum STM815]